MSTKAAKTSESSTSMPSVKRRTKKTLATPSEPGASLTKYGQADVLSRPSSSQLADAYETDEFLNEWANDVQFHLARNLLHLRRYRRMSQNSVARAMGTSQSAIARIESGQENITLDTLRRLVVALRGRFYVSIPPQESAPRQIRPWWEVDDSQRSQWMLVGYEARRDRQADQVLLALERRTTNGSTLQEAMMLEGSGTGD